MWKFLNACAEGALIAVVALIFWIFFGEFLGIPLEFFWDFLSISIVAYIIISFITKIINGDN